MTEADFQRQVTDLAELLGYQWAHFRPARPRRAGAPPSRDRLGKGWPDLVLIRERDHRLVVIEVKATGGRATADQKRVLDLFRAAGVETFVVWPNGFASIAEWLDEAGRPPRAGDPMTPLATLSVRR